MQAIVIFESLTGNTAKAGREIADQLTAAGIPTVASPITQIDLAALSAADLVIVGSWVDGIFIAGQRPGREGRLKKMPVIDGKKAAVYCTYALKDGKTLEKLSAIVMKMLAKRPADRFASMAQVVEHLESLLGVGAGPASPAQQHADQLEQHVEQYNQSTAAKVRRGLYFAFHILAGLLTAAGIILGNYILTGTTVWAWTCTTALRAKWNSSLPKWACSSGAIRTPIRTPNAAKWTMSR